MQNINVDDEESQKDRNETHHVTPDDETNQNTHLTDKKADTAKYDEHPIRFKSERHSLSNFYPCLIPIFGDTFKSVEHAYQYRYAIFHNHPEVAEEIKRAPNARIAKQTARRKIRREDVLSEWFEVRVSEMENILQVKFETCQIFQDTLLQSGKRILLEDVPDEFWGVGKDGSGDNTMGKILMRLRQANIDNENINNTGTASHQQINSPSHTTPKQKKVLIIGNSQVQDIDPTKFSKQHELYKAICYTIDQANNVVNSMTTEMDRVIIHLLTNDIKTASPEKVTGKMVGLVNKLCNKFPHTKVTVSLATPRGDTLKNEALEVNDRLLNLGPRRNVNMVHHNNLLKRGTDEIFTKHFKQDKIHLSLSGTKIIAANLKYSMEGRTQIPRRHFNGGSRQSNRNLQYVRQEESQGYDQAQQRNRNVTTYHAYNKHDKVQTVPSYSHSSYSQDNMNGQVQTVISPDQQQTQMVNSQNQPPVTNSYDQPQPINNHMQPGMVNSPSYAGVISSPPQTMNSHLNYGQLQYTSKECNNISNHQNMNSRHGYGQSNPHMNSHFNQPAEGYYTFANYNTSYPSIGT